MRPHHWVWNKVAVTSVFLAAAAITMFVFECYSIIKPPDKRIFPFTFPDDAHWIVSQGDEQAGAHYRIDFEIPASEIEIAWAAISADNGFEIVTNGSQSAKWEFFRGTRPFGSGNSEFGQKMYYASSALALNFPREYQWSTHANWKTSVFVDLTKDFKAGSHNSITVLAHSRHERPSFILTGEIKLKNGQVIPLRSNDSWRACFTTPTHTRQEWIIPQISVDHWDYCKILDHLPRKQFRLIPDGIFTETFRGAWLPKSDSKKYQTTWDIDDVDGEEWVRVMSTEPYILRINDKNVRPNWGRRNHYAEGGWMLKTTNRSFLQIKPETLDTDEISDVFSGKGYLNPKHGRPSENEPISGEREYLSGREMQDNPAYGNLMKRANEEFLERPSQADPMNEMVSTRTPPSLTKAYQAPNYSAFQVAKYLKKGRNKIELELYPTYRESKFYGLQAERISMDAGVINEEGQCDWGIDESTEWMTDGKKVLGGRMPLSNQNKLRYFQTWKERNLFFPYGIGTLIVAYILLFLANVSSRKVQRFLKYYERPFAAFVVMLLCLGLLKSAMAERSEIIFFEANPMWPWIRFLSALGVALWLAWLPIQKKEKWSEPSISNKWVIFGILLVILTVAFCLRGYKMHMQPLDDDEYASVQASLSVARKGLPELFDGIFYTRGPLFHYVSGALAKIFGSTIVTLRFYSIGVGVLCILFTYNLCSRVLQNRRMGLAVAIVLAVHPFCVFTSHIARFYQQQQLFTVLVVLFFIRGFVYDAPNWKRFAAVICFGAATLSQEISLLLIVPLGLSYATMSQKQSWANELKFVYCGCLVVACIGINMVIFQFLCLTRTSGKSATVESTLTPHFWEPMNAFSQWICYSRLHIFFGLFSFIGMAVAMRRRDMGIIAVTFFLVFGVLTTVILVTGLGFRYQYSYTPLFFVVAIYGIHFVCSYVSEGRGRQARIVVSGLVVGIGILSFSPWRIFDSYDERILPDSSSATNFVKANFRPGDKVAINEPHPHAALIEIGHSNYDICQPILYDFVFREKDGRLIDRNGGAESVGRVSVIQRIMAQHDRIWFILNREKFKNRARNLRWEYPGARLDLLVRKNCPLMYQAYSWEVYLWDRGNGRFHPFRMEPEGFSE